MTVSNQHLAACILFICAFAPQQDWQDQRTHEYADNAPPDGAASILLPLEDPEFDEQLAADFFVDSFHGTRGNRLVIILAGRTAFENELFRLPIRVTLRVNGEVAGEWTGLLRRGGHPIVRNGKRRGERTLESEIWLREPLLNRLIEARDDPTVVIQMSIETDLHAAASSRQVLLKQRIAAAYRARIDRARNRLESVDETTVRGERMKKKLNEQIESDERQLERQVVTYWDGHASTGVNLRRLRRRQE